MKKNSLRTLREQQRTIHSEFRQDVLAKAGTDLVFALATRAFDYKEIIRGINAKTKAEATEVSSIMGFEDLSYLARFLQSDLAQELYMGKYDNDFTLTRGTKEGAYQAIIAGKNYNRNIFGLQFSTNVPLSYSFPEYVEEKPLLQHFGSSFKGSLQSISLYTLGIQGFRQRLYKLSLGVSAVLASRIVARTDFDAAMAYDKAVKNFLILVGKISDDIRNSLTPEEKAVIAWQDDAIACYVVAALTVIATEFMSHFAIFEDAGECMTSGDQLENMTFQSLKNLFDKDAKTSYDILNKDIILDETAFVMYVFGLEDKLIDPMKHAIVESLKSQGETLFEAVKRLTNELSVKEAEKDVEQYE